MRKAILYLTFCVLISWMAGLTFAASGKAVIPHIIAQWTDSDNYHIPYIYVSNTTGSTISITITLYDQTGAVVVDTDDSPTGGIIHAANVSNYDDTHTDATVTFDLDAYETGYITYRPSTLKYGFGRIEWSQSGKASTGVVANGNYCRTGVSTSYRYQHGYLILINNGLPF